MGQSDHSETMGRMLQVSVAERRNIDVDLFRHAPAQVGMEMFIEFKVRGHSEKIKTKLVGYVSGEYLVVATPKVNGIPVNYGASNNTLVVRYLHEGSVFGFQTAALRMIGAPFYLTFLRYPESIEEVSLRRNPRISVVIPIERDDGDKESEFLINLSENGALLKLKKPVGIDDTIYLMFALPNGKVMQDLECRVRRVEMNSAQILAGVEFKAPEGRLAPIRQYLDMVQDNLSPNHN